MKAKELVIIAALLLAAIAPLRAQEWEKTNDTTWVRRYPQTNGVLSEYAYAVNQTELLAKINNDLRSAALLQTCSIGSGTLAAIAALCNAEFHRNDDPMLTAATVILGIGSVATGIGSIVKLHQKKVYLSPDGVIIRIGKVENPAYNNRKKR